MSWVLGIDAAWTESEPSGVALVGEADGRWRCAGLAPSYSAFCALAEGRAVDWDAPRHAGSRPDVDALVSAARALTGGASVDVVAVDMPIASAPFSTRRHADDEVSREFGGRKCGTHSPTAARPGEISRTLFAQASRAGYTLATEVAHGGARPALIEVYPHPALLALMSARERLTYKIGKASRYWPELDRAERTRKVLEVWRAVLDALHTRIADIALPLPAPSYLGSASSLKRFEDALDALVCAWCGIEYLAGRTKPYGDTTAAIWVPVDASAAPRSPRTREISPGP